MKDDITVDMPIDNVEVEDASIKEIKNRHVQTIRFGEEFETWDTIHKIAYLKKLASSMNQAADMMQTERNAMAVELQAAQNQLENMEENLRIQKAIVFKSITDTNQAKEDYINRIQLLESTVREQNIELEALQTRVALSNIL